MYVIKLEGRGRRSGRGVESVSEVNVLGDRHHRRQSFPFPSLRETPRVR